MIKLSRKFIIITCILLVFASIEYIAFASTSWEPESEPYIYSRSSWNARPPKTTLDSRGHGDYLIFHHTGWSFTSTSYTDAKNEIQEIQDYHMDENGWDDIGYHYIIDPYGRIWEGRDDSKLGSHCLGENESIGIVNLGDYEGLWGIGANSVTQRSYNAMVSLSKWLGYRESLDMIFVKNHNDFRDTACPGRNMEAYIYDDLAGNLSNSMVEQ